MEPEAKPPRIDPKTGRQLPRSPGRRRRAFGPRSKFNPDAAAQILTLVRAGNYPDTAAAFAGVAVSTLRAWVKDGMKGRTQELEDFARDLAAAEAVAEVAAVREMRRSPREARRFLERRFSARWGPKAQISLGGIAGGPVQVNLTWTEARGRG